MEDCLNTQHEEITVLRGRVCQCGGQPEVVEEEIEGVEELYAEEGPSEVMGEMTSPGG